MNKKEAIRKLLDEKSNKLRNKQKESSPIRNSYLLIIVSTFIIILILLFFVLKSENSTLKSETFVNQPEVANQDSQTLFENKQKCISYRQDIEKKMLATEWDKYVIEEIFYSAEENSCLFSVFAYKESSAYLGETYTAYMIFDYLTDTLVFYRDSTLTEGDDIKTVYENAVEYLQGNDSLKYDKSRWYLN